MPVEIVNMTPYHGDEKPNEYAVLVNGETKATFSHDRRLGLADCLYQASVAVDLRTRRALAEER